MNKRNLVQCAVILLVLLHFGCRHNNKSQQSSNNKKSSGKSRSDGHGYAVSNSQKSFAESLGLTEKQVKQSRLYTFIDEWYGAPYRYGGCRKSGIDCSCFVNTLYDQVYGKKVGRSSNEIFNQCKMLSIREAREGDLVFFKINSKTVSHVGIFITNKLFIHASTSRGVILNNLDEAYYKKFFFCAGRLQDV
jgi:murein DD-endopeptidase / murein LD-carboxypeptidase